MPPATYTLPAPNSASFAFDSSLPGPVQTTDGDPSLRAAVSSSVVTFFTALPECSARTSTSAIDALSLPSSRWGSDELALGQERGRLGAAVPLVLHDHPGRPGRPCREVDPLGHRPGRARRVGGNP